MELPAPTEQQDSFLSNTPSTVEGLNPGPVDQLPSSAKRPVFSTRHRTEAILIPALPYKRQPGQLFIARREIERLTLRVNRLEALNRTFALKAQELDRLQPQYLALFEAYGSLLRVVQGYNTITANCENCRHWIDFILALSLPTSGATQSSNTPQDR